MIEEVLRKEALKFAFNKHATHVLIKFIKLVEVEPYLVKIFATLTKHISKLAQDPNGLPVVKTFIAKFQEPKFKQDLILGLSEHAVLLSQNAYGNYAMQVALEVRFGTLNLCRNGPMKTASCCTRTSFLTCSNSLCRSLLLT